jgi:hypothetical protein
VCAPATFATPAATPTAAPLYPWLTADGYEAFPGFATGLDTQFSIVTPMTVGVQMVTIQRGPTIPGFQTVAFSI